MLGSVSVQCLSSQKGFFPVFVEFGGRGRTLRKSSVGLDRDEVINLNRAENKKV